MSELHEPSSRDIDFMRGAGITPKVFEVEPGSAADKMRCPACRGIPDLFVECPNQVVVESTYDSERDVVVPVVVEYDCVHCGVRLREKDLVVTLAEASA